MRRKEATALSLFILGVLGNFLIAEYPRHDLQRPRVFPLSCSRKATEVPALLFPSSSIHSTSPVSRQTAE